MKMRIMAAAVAGATMLAGVAGAQTTGYFVAKTNSGAQAALNTPGNWSGGVVPTNSPGGGAGIAIFTNNTFHSTNGLDSVRFQTNDVGTVLRFSDIRFITGTDGSWTTNMFTSSSVIATNRIEVGVADGARSYWHVRSSNLYVTNTAGTALLLVGGTNTGYGALEESQGGPTWTFDNFIATNNASMYSFGGANITINYKSIVKMTPGGVDNAWGRTLTFRPASTNDWEINTSVGVNALTVTDAYLKVSSTQNTRMNNLDVKYNIDGSTVHWATPGIRIGSPSGAPALISNDTLRISGSVFTNGGFIRVGEGSVGAAVLRVTGNSLQILNNSKVTNAVLSIAYVGGSSNCTADANSALVDNATYTVLNSAYVGHYVGSGTRTNTSVNSNTLTIQNSGTMNVMSNLLVGYVESNPTRLTEIRDNEVKVDGGTLNVSNGGGTGLLDVRHGKLTMVSGTVSVDKLSITNPVSGGFFGGGSIDFQGGTLNVKSTTVSNGQAFTVGNSSGTGDAVLNLQGGTHRFNNGLIMNSDAKLTGNGTLMGDVTISGILAPGTSPGTNVFNNNLTLGSSSVSTMEVANVGVTLSGNDLAQVVGNLTLNNGANLGLSLSGTPVVGNTWTLFDVGGTRLGVFANYDPGLGTTKTFVDAGTTYKLDYAGGTGSDITLTVIPEPATLGTVALGVASLLWLRRRREQKG